MAIESVDEELVMDRLQNELPASVFTSRQNTIQKIIQQSSNAITRPNGVVVYEGIYRSLREHDESCLQFLRDKMNTETSTHEQERLNHILLARLDILACRDAVFRILMEQADPQRARSKSMLRQRFKES